jgi:hypothetical protein
MTWINLFGFLNAACAGLLAGLAFTYAHWVHREGSGRRRWMVWLGPIWGTVALYHAAIWAADAIRPEINTVPLMRPCSWLLLAIPAFTLFLAMAEDKQSKAERESDARLVEAKRAEIEGVLHGA